MRRAENPPCIEKENKPKNPKYWNSIGRKGENNLKKRANKGIESVHIIDTDKDIFIYPTKNGQEQIKISNILKLDESQKIIRKNQQSYGTYYIELTASLEGYKVFEFSDKSHRDEVYSLLYGVIKYGTK